MADDPARDCRAHAGIIERLRDLEGRQAAASGERSEMRREIVELRVSMAKMLGVWAVVIILIQAGVAFAIKALTGG